MKYIFIISLALVALIAWLIIIPNLLDKEAELVRAQAHLEYSRFQGQALVMQAQGQNRLDTSVALAGIIGSTATATASIFPWFVIGVLIAFGMLVLKRQERRVYLPPSYLPRREVWRELERMKHVEILPGIYTEQEQ